MAPAEVPEIASIFSHGSSRSRSSTPQVNAPCEPPPCRARSIRTGLRFMRHQTMHRWLVQHTRLVAHCGVTICGGKATWRGTKRQTWERFFPSPLVGLLRNSDENPNFRNRTENDTESIRERGSRFAPFRNSPLVGEGGCEAIRVR